MTGYLFVTEPGWNLLTTGPFNHPRDGISPLTGVIETDWLPYPFTMNWQMTRPGTVRFERGDAFCLIFPVRKDELEAADVEIYNLADDPELEKKQKAWREKRDEFMVKFRAGDGNPQGSLAEILFPRSSARQRRDPRGTQAENSLA